METTRIATRTVDGSMIKFSLNAILESDSLDRNPSRREIGPESPPCPEAPLSLQCPSPRCSAAVAKAL
jgi:hypothetical protein